MSRTRHLRSSIVGATIFTLSFSAIPAYAAPVDDTGTELAANSVISEELSITAEAAAVYPETGGSGFVADVDGVETVIPADAEDGVSITQDDQTVQIGLPAADAAEPIEQATTGLLVYDNNDGSYTVPIPGEQGDLQLNTVIESPTAPTEYSYQLDLPTDVQVLSENGAYVFLDSDGSVFLLVAPPGAKDANGQDVPTHYEFADGILTQVVEHSTEFAYPVVADPWLGVSLFGLWSTGTHQGEIKYNAWVTPQAIATLGAPVVLPGGPLVSHALWLSVMSGAGWNEWTTRWPAITNKASLRQQFECHINAGIIGTPFTRDYNLERSRPNRGAGGWQSGVLFHRCNWAYATGTATN